MFKLLLKLIKRSYLIIVFCCLSFLLAQESLAATLYLSPNSGSYEVGKTFTSSVFVGAQGESINSSDASINFPADLLEVVSLSKSGSIFTLWVEDPSFSNGSGNISYVGGLPAPGFSGASGKVLSIVFRVKKAGAATISLSSAAVRASDGLGTNVLKGAGSAKLTLTDKVDKAPESPAVPEKPVDAKEIIEKIANELPGRLALSSPTHADQAKWYANPNPSFTWNLPAGTTELKLLYDQSPNSTPSISYTSPVNQKSFDKQADGTYYFHAQLKNKVGWGAIAHYAVNIDQTQPTDLQILELDADRADKQSAKFLITAADSLSGIDYYELQINDDAPQVWRDDGSHRYETPKLSGAAYTLKIKAFDKAGNYISAVVPFATTAKLTQAAKPATADSLSVFINLLAKVLPFLLLFCLVVLFIWGIWYGAHKFLALRSAVRPKAAVSSKKVSQAFELLRENMWKQVEVLHRASATRALTIEEKLILKQLKKDLNKAEDILTR